MKAVHKPIEYDVWKNLAEDEEGHEPMPDWVMRVADSEAKAGGTFLIRTAHGPALVKIGDYVIKGPTDTYPCSPGGFAAVYEEQK